MTNGTRDHAGRILSTILELKLSHNVLKLFRITMELCCCSCRLLCALRGLMNYFGYLMHVACYIAGSGTLLFSCRSYLVYLHCNIVDLLEDVL